MGPNNEPWWFRIVGVHLAAALCVIYFISESHLRHKGKHSVFVSLPRFEEIMAFEFVLNALTSHVFTFDFKAFTQLRI